MICLLQSACPAPCRHCPVRSPDQHQLSAAFCLLLLAPRSEPLSCRLTGEAVPYERARCPFQHSGRCFSSPPWLICLCCQLLLCCQLPLPSCLELEKTGVWSHRRLQPWLCVSQAGWMLFLQQAFHCSAGWRHSPLRHCCCLACPRCLCCCPCCSWHRPGVSWALTRPQVSACHLWYAPLQQACSLP